MAHRRFVIVGWVVLAIGSTVLAGAVGRQYTNNFSLPGTEAQRVLNLLTSQFKAQSGDVDTIVFHYDRGPITSPAVKSAIVPLLASVKNMPHVESVISPYTPQGVYGISKNGRTAFAVINYDKRVNLLANDTGKPVLNAVNAVHVRGLKVAAGGQVIEQAEGFNIGPATTVGVIAAMIILLFTFGSLTAAGMPLITAGLGLLTGLALVGFATHLTDMANVSPELALMIGLGVGIDYALFIVTRFRENYSNNGDVNLSIVQAMDTSGRAILLAGTTVVIALLGMFATQVSFMYGLAIASVLAVLCVMLASLTVLPAFLSRFGHRVVRPSRRARRRAERGEPEPESAWRRWSLMVQSRPWPLAVIATLVMVLFAIPWLSMRLDTSDAGNDPAGTSTQAAYSMLADGFGPGFNGPLLVSVQPRGSSGGSVAANVGAVRDALAHTPGIVTVTQPRIAPSGRVAVMEAYPSSSPQAQATENLVNHLRDDVLPPVAHKHGLITLIGGQTAGSIDFSNVLASKLPLFVGLVVVVSALLLFVIFRSLVIPIQAGLMNLLSIAGALGFTTLVFQQGFLSGVLGVTPGPIEPWIPVLMFAVVFGLSMDYEVFLISRVREEWVHRGNAREAVAEGIAHTGKVISAAAAIMICVFLSFMFGSERAIKEFGFGLAAAVFLDALVVRCVLLPAVLELLGETTWKLPRWLDKRLPHINIEGSGPDAYAVEEAEISEEVGEPVAS